MGKVRKCKYNHSRESGTVAATRSSKIRTTASKSLHRLRERLAKTAKATKRGLETHRRAVPSRRASVVVGDGGEHQRNATQPQSAIKRRSTDMTYLANVKLLEQRLLVSPVSSSHQRLSKWPLSTRTASAASYSTDQIFDLRVCAWERRFFNSTILSLRRSLFLSNFLFFLNHTNKPTSSQWTQTSIPPFLHLPLHLVILLLHSLRIQLRRTCRLSEIPNLLLHLPIHHSLLPPSRPLVIPPATPRKSLAQLI